ncbi:A disintegrin and metalloproteinase with thrombospondin motifs 12 isoform X2 [Xenopus laevis]|uniref:A disintegrin and metalloproteinase with thrombospondin motifs 12 isoform X2 n=1 Tax=Xenopus laevis TaxID=8355 RepID=A0A8J0VMU9_XENLA|nr:A disintegrin and metalloproteinase with thrombospondin motifs 12 isoform X2 [Xenopus laevis]
MNIFSPLLRPSHAMYAERPDCIYFIFYSIPFLLATCHGTRLHQDNSHFLHQGQERLDHTLPSGYEVVEPVKVDERGDFLSYNLQHPAERTRRKRNVAPQAIHYRIRYKADDLFLNLTFREGFLSDNFILERRNGNYSQAQISPLPGTGCHLTGTAQQAHVGNGIAAISVCDGLAGFFRLPDGDYFIEPLHGATQVSGKPHQHIIYRRETTHRNRRELPISSGGFCAVNDTSRSVLQQELQREEWERNYLNGRKISQRSVSKERWVETLVVADTKMIGYHGSNNVESYIFTIMNMVAGLFHDSNIGNAIHIKVVRLILLEEEEEGLKIVHNADQTLASFCKWQKSINPKSDAHPAHHDVAVLLTRKDICASKNSPCETLGLSHLSGMCQSSKSCNINEDTGLPLAFTIAHELGHSFGIQHDGQGNDCEIVGRNPYIMSRQLQYNTSPLTWSPCSKEYITRFLDRGWGFCLDDVPAKKGLKPPIIAPGVLYDVNHQCQLQYGPNATFCEEVDNVCQTLWCSVKNSCRSKLDSAADGTRCGENKWCFNGKCITVGTTPQTINGGWGAWTPWSHCSRTCGAGVESAERNCNNPQPKFGGKYCTGERKRYRICNIQPCLKDNPTFREMQCTEFNTVPYKNELYQWIPLYNTENPCELHCRSSTGNFANKLLDAVIDGTPCFDRNKSREVCINGICKKVGCDYEIDSNATEDRCGVCLGDGSSCQTIKKEFNQTDGFGYVDVGLIPKGARDIKIEEVAEAGNFLALRSEDPEKYYLNGKYIIQWNGEYKVAGTIFHYQRNNDFENITASGPTNESIWIQLLFQEHNPGVRYEYVAQKDANLENEIESIYTWRYGGWTDCSATCGTGVQHQIARCVNKKRGVVKNTFCDQEMQPMTRQKKCNTKECPPRWWVGQWQQCSTTCGPTGEKKRTVLCLKTSGSDEEALPSEDCHHLTKPKIYMSCNRDILCPSDWTVGNWSECSVTCGGGVRTRNITCAKNNDEPCDSSKKPNSKALCGLQQCYVQKTLPRPPIKYKYRKKIIKKKPGPKRRIFLPNKNQRVQSTTRSPKVFMSASSTPSSSPSVRSIKEDFQINEIPNSTHFNIDYKYDFVLVENNKKKVQLNATSLIPSISNKTKGDNMENDTVTEKDSHPIFTTTHPPEELTSRYEFLTKQPETQTKLGKNRVSTAIPDNDYDTAINFIIESRSKRHKGKMNQKQNNSDTYLNETESPNNSSIVINTTPLRIYNTVTTSETNSTRNNKDWQDVAPTASAEPYFLRVTTSNTPENSTWKLHNASNRDHLNSTHYGNGTGLNFNVSKEVYWIVGNWSECSKNCQGGFKTREVQCVDIRENRPLRPFHCQSPGKNPEQNTSCNTEACLSWLAKPWSECSKTCGGGIRQRQVFCPKADRCDWKKIPPISLNCSEEPCTRWNISSWMECSVSCGGGTQRRNIECMNTHNNSMVHHDLCEKAKAKPLQTQECNQQECQKNAEDPPCKRDKMSVNFCRTVKSIGRCSVKSIRTQCCFTCAQL